MTDRLKGRLRHPTLGLGLGLGFNAAGGNRQSISLDFTTSETLDSRITVSGATNGTRTNSSKRIEAKAAPRFDYHPVSGAALGLLIEEARTNLVAAPKDFTGWTKANAGDTLTADTTAAPDGTTTADSFLTQAAIANHRLASPSFNVANGVTYCQSLYCGAGTGRYAQQTFGGGNFSGVGYANFDLTLGTVTATGGVVAASGVGLATGGMYRPWIAQACTNTSSDSILFYQMAAGNEARNANANPGAVTVTPWGAQVEAGLFPTSYIDGNLTRSADSLTMTGAGFSEWWTAARGTIVVQADSPGSGTRTIWQADDGTANNRITIYTTGTTAKCDVVVGGLTVASLSLGSVTAKTSFKIALAFAQDDFAACLNGGTVQTDSAGGVPIVDRCRFGSDVSGNQLCGHLSSFRAFSGRRSNADLQTLST